MSNGRRKCRYNSETVKIFPLPLLYFRFTLSNESQHELRLARHHSLGTPVPVVDLRGWEEINSWVDSAKRMSVDKRIRGVNLADRTDVDMKYLHNLLQHFPDFDTIHIDGCLSLQPQPLVQCLLQFTLLHTLSIGGLQLIDADFDALVQGLIHLRHLDISKCTSLTNASLKSIAHHAFELTTLAASENPNFTVEGANELIMNCQQMHKLTLSNCPQLTFFGIIISHHGMIQYGSWNVKDINLSGCTDLHIESLMWLEAANPYLHHVCLSNIKQLNDAVVAGISSSCEQLRQLEIANCRKVGNIALQEIAKNCRKNLTTLNISGLNKHVESAAIKEILTYCGGLTALDMSGNKRVTDDAFVDIPVQVESQSSPKKKHKSSNKKHFLQTPKLTSLNLAHCPKVTTYGISVLAEKHASTLTSLDISGLVHVTDISLNVVAMSCHKKLLTFIADDCTRLTDVGIGYLCKHCVKLETLSLSSSTRFLDSWFTRVKQYTDTSLEHIFFSLKRLRVLRLRNQCSLTFSSPRLCVDFATSMGLYHFSLSELDLSGSDYLNPAGLACVLSKCYSLCSVWLTESKSMPWVHSSDFLSAAFKHSLYSSAITPAPVKGAGAGGKHHKGQYMSKMISSKSMNSIATTDSDQQHQNANPHLHERKMSALSASSSASASVVSKSSSTLQSRTVATTTAGASIDASLASASSVHVDAVIDPTEIDNPKYIQVLIPLPNKDHLHLRDLYVRQRLLMLFSARVIQQRFRMFRFWKKIRRYVRARQISLWYRQILDYRTYLKKLRRFIEKRAINMIFRTFKNSNLRVKARAACKIQRVYRGCRARAYVKRFIIQMKAATVIQSVVRGMLYRLSDHYILGQLFLKLPPFWQTVMNAAPAEKYYEKYRLGSEIYQARHATQNMVEHIKHDIVHPGRRLAPRLPFIVPQPFDKKPYVSLGDGRKMDIFKDIKGLLNTDGMRGAAAAASRRAALEHGMLHDKDNEDSKKPQERKHFYKAVTGNRSPPRTPNRSPSRGGTRLLENGAVQTTLAIMSSTASSTSASSSSVPLLNVETSSSNGSVAGGSIVPFSPGNGGSASNSPVRRGSSGSNSPSRSPRRRRNSDEKALVAKKKKHKPRGHLHLPYKEHIPVHMFNIVFWPHTEPLEAVDTTTDQHDPSQNAFDLIQNTRTALYCMLCDKKLRVVFCKTCHKGYCFDCAFRVHSAGLRRKHAMDIIEPRVVTVKEVSNSLVYHIEAAQKASYDLGYLVKYLRSAAEAKRLADERRIAKEYELAEEHKRMEHLKALQENEDKHLAATKIQLLYRRAKARKYVNQRRHQKHLEATLAAQHKLELSFMTFQRLFRRRSSVKWIGQFGIHFFDKHGKKRKKKSMLPGAKSSFELSEKELRARIDFEIQQRRILTRGTLFHKLYESYIKATQLVEVNIESWLKMDAMLDTKEKHLQGLIKQFTEEHETEMKRIGLLKAEVTEEEFALMEKEVRRLMVRVEAAKERVQSWGALRWWLVQHLRGNYRRKKIIAARYADTIQRLEWVAVESAIVGRMEYQMRERVKRLGNNKDLGKAVEWLNKFVGLGLKHQATLDTKQETILQEEINRLEMDAMITTEFDALMEEFFQTARAHTQYIAERCYLDQASLVGPGARQGSEEGVKISKRLVAIRKKQLTLEDTVLDTIKKGLQAKLNNEDEKNMNYYGFPNDFPEREIHTFDEIEVVLLEKFEAHSHFDIEEFFRIFMAQPWLGDLAVEDVRVEEEIMTNELNLGKATEELKGLTFTTQSTEEKMTACNRKLIELTQELERRQVSVDGDDELPEDAAERLRIIDVLTREKLGCTAELSLHTGVLENTKNFASTSRSRMVHFAEEIARLQEILQGKRQERTRLVSVFFDKESVCSSEIHTQIAELQDKNERAHQDTVHQLRYCEAAQAQVEMQERIVKGELSVPEREAFGIPMKSSLFKLQECLHSVKPHINTTPLGLASICIRNRLFVLQSNINYLEAVGRVLAAEEAVLFEFKDRRAGYANAIKMFQDDIIRLQRQKALQRELEERMERLKFLRETRMRHQLEEKKAAIDAAMAAENEKKKKPPPVNVVSEGIKAAKRAIRGLKDNYNRIMHEAATAMDEEEIRIANRLREKSKTGAGPIVALRKLHITWSIDEGNSFQEQNKFFEERGMPFFRQISKGFGFQLYVWTQSTTKIQEFITSIELGHKDPTHPKYKDLMEDGYEKVEHEKSPLIFWVKRDPKKSRSIAEITFSFDEQDDIRCFADGFERLKETPPGEAPESLEDFGFPPSTIWVRKVDKLKHEEKLNVDALAAEYKNVVDMLNKNPKDTTLKNLVDKVRERLAAARDKELVNGEMLNPLTPSVDLMALNGDELEAWIAVFRKFDKEKSGALSLDRIFETIEETPTSFAKSIFTSMDALDPETGLVECGDFMRVCSTYCFFGKQEILRTIYNFADKSKAGEITHDQFVNLLNVLNPYDKIRAKRALTEMELKAGKIMKFKEFAEINEKFPALFYPAFRLQKSLRDHTMGFDWWVDKLKKYKAVRKKMVLIDNNADELAEIEMKRYLDDEKRAKRMAAREMEIKTEASTARRTLLQARQFLDEFS